MWNGFVELSQMFFLLFPRLKARGDVPNEEMNINNILFSLYYSFKTLPHLELSLYAYKFSPWAWYDVEDVKGDNVHNSFTDALRNGLGIVSFQVLE